MRKPFVLAWAISPEQVVQFVKGQTTGWSVQSKKHHVKFNHITWNAAYSSWSAAEGSQNSSVKAGVGHGRGSRIPVFSTSSPCFITGCSSCISFPQFFPVGHWSEVALMLRVSPGAFSRILGLPLSSLCWNHSFLFLSFCVVWSL